MGKQKKKKKKTKLPKELRKKSIQNEKALREKAFEENQDAILEHLAQLKGKVKDRMVRGIVVIEIGSPGNNSVRWSGTCPPGEVSLPINILQRIFVDMALPKAQAAPKTPKVISVEDDSPAPQEADEAEAKRGRRR